MGAEKFLFFGSAGVLDRELAAGHLIIPTAAYRDEGTRHGNDMVHHSRLPGQSRMAVSNTICRYVS